MAAELAAEREEAARMSNRLRFAEDKILQQVSVKTETVHPPHKTCVRICVQ